MKDQYEREGCLFLTPEWIHEVRDAIERTRQQDPHFHSLLTSFTMNVKYLIRGIPESLQTMFGGGGKSSIFVQLHQGSVQEIHFGRKPAGIDVHLVVTIDYDAARRLFLGESSPARMLMSGNVKAEPVNGFRHWHSVAAKSLVTASRVLRTARKVPTAFALAT